eukprot:3628345-Pyramimonas_sp.AAC.1
MTFQEYVSDTGPVQLAYDFGQLQARPARVGHVTTDTATADVLVRQCSHASSRAYSVLIAPPPPASEPSVETADGPQVEK